MKPMRRCLSAALCLSLLAPLTANAWYVRGGGGARTYVVPHTVVVHPVQPVRPLPPPPPPHPYPGPGPYPGPHPYPGPPRPLPPPPPPPPHPDDWYHPWAAAAVVGATTAAVLAIGTRVATVPVDCVSVIANGVAYQHCGPTWYQPQYVGSSVQYIVVTAPW
ncbi:hypothetical protein [Pseudomonas purpurea]|uniref:hypothetical protein n=1 Tax=Pseudomonas purpurea TaxID=3136737 RepID=UPI003263FE5B